MKTLNKESELLDRYKLIPSYKIKYIGNFFSCFRIEILTHSFLHEKSWINSSGKGELPPDYHNDKYHIMMEMMRVDDCVKKLNGKHVSNSFKKENECLKTILGYNYKKTRDDISVFFVSNTDNPNDYNYESYLNNFRDVIFKHSKKINKYKHHYPKCKKVIFFISDESNEYYEAFNLEDKNKIESGTTDLIVKWHEPYKDIMFIDAIKKTECDYIIWLQHYKTKKQRFRLVVPEAIIIDVKRLKRKGIKYNKELMAKIKEVNL